MPTYLLDTNFFIQAHRQHYPLDVALNFWTKLIDLASRGVVISIDKVSDELYKNADPLTHWCQSSLPSDFFHNTQSIITQYAQVANWANSRSNHYSAAALTEFLAVDEADAWLVAKALSSPSDLVIVTHEKSDPLNKRRIKIPEACAPFGVSFVNTVGMFRAIGETF